MRRVVRAAAVALATMSAVVTAACGSSPQVTGVYSPEAWPARYGDAHNSDTTAVTGARSIDSAWSRPLGAPVTASASVASTGQISLTTRSETGCNLWSFQMDTGRKRWCTRIGPGVGTSTPLVDKLANIYIGDDGAMSSYNDHGQLRWRTFVSGTPTSAQFTGDGNLLFVTQFGAISVLNPQNGREVAPPFFIQPVPTPDQGQDAPLLPAGLGLDRCFPRSPECPVADTPAVDTATGRFYLSAWLPGRPTSVLAGMRYADGAITQEWTTDVLHGGSASSPVLSRDASTLYVGDNQGWLWALDASTGQPKWSHELGFTAVNVSVADDGTLIPTGHDDGHLLALRDAGDRAESLWDRADVRQLGTPAQSAGDTGYTVVRDGDDGLAVLTFDTTTGETLDQDVLPGAQGVTVGTSIGPEGEVLVPTLIGELFVLTP